MMFEFKNTRQCKVAVFGRDGVQKYPPLEADLMPKLLHPKNSGKTDIDGPFSLFYTLQQHKKHPETLFFMQITIGRRCTARKLQSKLDPARNHHVLQL